VKINFNDVDQCGGSVWSSYIAFSI
jgi:hypothetical protein